MQLVTYLSAGEQHIAVRKAQSLYPLEDLDAALPQTMNELLSALPQLVQREAELLHNSEPLADEVQLAPPVPNPGKIIAIGLNYADHAAESGSEIPSEPVVFNKFTTALRADGQAIELPAASNEVDYEAELVVVIGKEAKNVPVEKALDYVAGYTCGHDVSARDWQKNKPQGQWLLGKSFDSFAPLGPALVTTDEIADPHNLGISMRLNGEVMQQSNTKQFIFRIDQLIAYLSQVCTLQPGDLIFTGTPPGVGAARKPPVFLKPGDVAEVEIEGIGVLRNPVVAADAGA